MRAETGPLRFGDDWTGVFVRGDDADYFLNGLERCGGEVVGFSRIVIDDLINLFKKANDLKDQERSSVQKLKEFELCL